MKKERELLPDILKGFAIIMVVWGHCIQEGNGAAFSSQMLYFDDKLYQFIYSFHMPLFAIIAGYFAYLSIERAIQNKTKHKLLVKRLLSYGIPIFVWTMLEYIRECIINVTNNYVSLTPISFISGYFSKLIINHWFLWSMIICFVIVWIMHCYFKDNLLIYTLGFISLFFIPDGLNMHAYKFLMPFYIGAFYFCKFYVNYLDSKVNCNVAITGSGFFEFLKSLVKQFSKNNKLLLLISFIGFALLFLIYRKEAFIYVSGYRITKNIWWKMIIIDLYRMIIGFVGSVFWISFFRELTLCFNSYKFPILSAFGKYSLGVYLISGYTTILIMRRFTDSLSYSIPRVILETVVIATFSLAVTVGMSKIPFIKRIVGK